MNRLMESSVGTVSPALSSLSKPHEPPEFVRSPPPECVVSYQYLGGTQSYGPSFSPDGPSFGLDLYSAADTIGTVKSACWNACSVTDSVEDAGALSLQLNVTTLGWLRSRCPIVNAESLNR